jgi:hypothetical protein
MSKVRAGKDGEPVPAGTRVFRIGKRTQLSPEAKRTGRASPEMFELSSEDKNSEGQRLSIWVEEITIADQAWDFMGAKEECDIVACLCVDGILSIPSQTDFERPRVEWETARTIDAEGRIVRNDQPGAEGHCGITGLNQGGHGRVHKNRRKEMRSDLADAAKVSPVPIPHDIPEEHLRVAAYYLFEKDTENNRSQEDHWISAIRQLRRERVQEQYAGRLALPES